MLDLCLPLNNVLLCYFENGEANKSAAIIVLNKKYYFTQFVCPTLGTNYTYPTQVIQRANNKKSLIFIKTNMPFHKFCKWWEMVILDLPSKVEF